MFVILKLVLRKSACILFSNTSSQHDVIRSIKKIKNSLHSSATLEGSNTVWKVPECGSLIFLVIRGKKHGQFSITLMSLKVLEHFSFNRFWGF